MPCVYHETDQEIEERESERREALDKLTRMLCAVITQLEKDGVANVTLKQAAHCAKGLYPNDIVDWWKAHQAEDRKRIRFEEAQKNMVMQRELAQLKALKEKYENG